MKDGKWQPEAKAFKWQHNERVHRQETKMLIAKILTKKGQEIIAEILMQGPVAFDPRPGWVLLKLDPHRENRKRELMWVHPDDEVFVWVRKFDF